MDALTEFLSEPGVRTLMQGIVAVLIAVWLPHVLKRASRRRQPKAAKRKRPMRPAVSSRETMSGKMPRERKRIVSTHG